MKYNTHCCIDKFKLTAYSDLYKEVSLIGVCEIKSILLTETFQPPVYQLCYLVHIERRLRNFILKISLHSPNTLFLFFFPHLFSREFYLA